MAIQATVIRIAPAKLPRHEAQVPAAPQNAVSALHKAAELICARRGQFQEMDMIAANHELLDRRAQASGNLGWPYQQQQALNPLSSSYNDPTSRLAAAITDHAAAIRELADVLYHINTED